MSDAILLQPGLDLDAIQSSYPEQYFGVWAMQRDPLLGMANWVRGLNIEEHLKSDQAKAAMRGNDSPIVEQQVAVMELRGSLMKQRSSYGGTSTAQAARTVRTLDKNPDIGAIVMLIDSPGGTVAGTRELANTIRGTNTPIVTFFEDLGASAAYWIGSASDEVYANETGMVGSIGTFGVVYDSSQAAEDAGIVVHVVRAGDFKGMGTPGTEITQEQLDYLQNQVNQYNEFFLEAVEQNTGMNRKAVMRVADGRTFIAEEAKEKGLIDGIMTFDEVIARAQTLAADSSTRVAASDKPVSLTKEDAMSTTETPVAVAAKPHEIKAACPGASNDFIVEQMMAEATLADAKDAYLIHMQEQNEKEKEELRAQLEEAQKANSAPAPAPAKKIGVPPVATSPSSGAGAISAVQEYRSLFKKYAAEGMKNKIAIAERIDAEQPDLRLRAIREANDDPNWEERRPS